MSLINKILNRISPIQRPHYIPSSYTYQFFEKSYSCIVFTEDKQHSAI